MFAFIGGRHSLILQGTKELSGIALHARVVRGGGCRDIPGQ